LAELGGATILIVCREKDISRGYTLNLTLTQILAMHRLVWGRNWIRLSPMMPAWTISCLALGGQTNPQTQHIFHRHAGRMMQIRRTPTKAQMAGGMCFSQMFSLNSWC
jgi:hypothetical protein